MMGLSMGLNRQAIRNTGLITIEVQSLCHLVQY
jgi:hypothetical protein